MVEPLVCSQTFEALHRASGGSLNESSKGSFRALGVDFDHPFRPAYPLEVWVEAMDLGSSLLTPRAPAPERHFFLGRRMVDSYEDTLVGRAVLAIIRLIGPRRAFERITRDLRTTNSYTQSRLETSPDGTLTLWCSQVVSAGFFCGMFTRILEAAGADEPKVEVISHDASGCTFSVQWQK